MILVLYLLFDLIIKLTTWSFKLYPGIYTDKSSRKKQNHQTIIVYLCLCMFHHSYNGPLNCSYSCSSLRFAVQKISCVPIGHLGLVVSVPGFSEDHYYCILYWVYVICFFDWRLCSLHPICLPLALCD